MSHFQYFKWSFRSTPRQRLLIALNRPFHQYSCINRKLTSIVILYPYVGLGCVSGPTQRLWSSTLTKPCHPPSSMKVSNLSTCTYCSAPVEGILPILCPSCKKILPIFPHATYFHLIQPTSLDPEDNFNIDPVHLKKVFLERQQAVHPDNYATKTREERLNAEVQSSWLNKAFETLNDPFKRAAYILELKGAALRESDLLNDNAFLMEIMELREEVEEEDTYVALKRLLEKNQKQKNELIKELQQAFSKKDLVLAKSLTLKLRYRNNVEQAVKDKQ